jgi:hypothetical protein
MASMCRSTYPQLAVSETAFSYLSIDFVNYSNVSGLANYRSPYGRVLERRKPLLKMSPLDGLKRPWRDEVQSTATLYQLPP